jgi:fucose permease
MAHHPPSSEDVPLLNDQGMPSTFEQHASEPAVEKMNNLLSFRIAAAMYSFITLGLFNSSVGAVLPLLSQHYHLTDLQVSSIFLAGPTGYVIAAQCSDTIHHCFGQRGIAVAGPVLQIIATATAASHPRFGLVLVAFSFQGLGTGLLDGSWCAWAGSMEKANTISGLLHGSYSVGGAMGPFLVTILTTHKKAWWTWYGILVSLSRWDFEYSN